MAYETHWEPSGIRFVFTGTVTDDDLIQSNKDVYDDPRFEDIRYQIADFRDMDEFAALSDTVRLIADMDREQASRNPDIKVAILSTSSLMKGLGRMYALSGAGEEWDVRVFDTEEEAREWFGD